MATEFRVCSFTVYGPDEVHTGTCPTCGCEPLDKVVSAGIIAHEIGHHFESNKQAENVGIDLQELFALLDKFGYKVVAK